MCRVAVAVCSSVSVSVSVGQSESEFVSEKEQEVGLSKESANGKGNSRSNKANYGFEFGDSWDTETWFGGITRYYSWYTCIFQCIPKIWQPRVHVQKRVRRRLRMMTPA